MAVNGVDMLVYQGKRKGHALLRSMKSMHMHHWHVFFLTNTKLVTWVLDFLDKSNYKKLLGLLDCCLLGTRL